MADIERTIAVIFSGTDQLSGTIASVSSGIDGFAGKVTNITAPLASMADMILKVEGAMAALAAGGLALAVKSAGDFQAGFNEISTLIDVNDQALKNFELSIKAYAAGSTQSIDSVNKAVYDAISAGVDYDKSLTAVAASEKLAVATKASLNDALNLLVPTLNAFGQDMSSAGDFADILFSTVKSGKTTLTELAGPLGQITGLAGPAGISFDQLGAAIAGLTAGGLGTSEAITGLKAALSNIIKPSSEAEEAAGKLKIKFDAQALAAMGLEKFLKMVYDATGGNVTKMGELFGSMEGLNAAFKLGEDASGKYASALEQMAQRAGAADAAFTKMSENFNLINQNIINNLKLLLIDIGQPLLDDYAKLAADISGIFQGMDFGVKSDAFKPVIDMLEAFAGQADTALKNIVQIINNPDFWKGIDFSPLVDSIKSLAGEFGTAFGSLFDNVDLTTAEGLQSAIQEVINVISNLTNATAGIVNAWQPVFTKIGEAVNYFGSLDAAAAKTSGEFLGLGQIINTIASNVGVLTGALDTMAYAISFGSVASGLKSLVSVLGTAGVATGGTVVGGFVAAGLAAIAFAADLERRFGAEQVEPITDVFKRIATEFGPGIDALASGFENAALELDALGKSGAYYWESLGYANQVVDEARMKQAAYSNALKDTPTDITTTVDLVNIEKSKADLGLFSETLLKLGEGPVDVLVEAKVNEASALDARDFMIQTIYKNGEPITVISKAQPDTASIENTKAALDTIPSEKILAIKLQGQIDAQIAKIKADAATIQTAVEWKAKLDIAEAEAAAKKFEASAELIKESFESTGDVLLGLFEVYGGASGLKALNISDWIEAESKRRDQLLKLETDLVNSEIELTNARAHAIERGESLITITGEGLEPELEAFMLAILKRVQMRMAEDNAAMLLGLVQK